MSEKTANLSPSYATNERVDLLSDRQHELWVVQQRGNEAQAELNGYYRQSITYLTRAAIALAVSAAGNAIAVIVLAVTR